MTGLTLEHRVTGSAYMACRLMLAVIFIWSGASKLLDPVSFARLIAEYGLLPEVFLGAAALGIPALELAAGLGLAFDIRFSLETVTALLFLFIGVLWFGIVKDLGVDCGCFSPGEAAGKAGLRRALFRDLFFIAAAAYCFTWRRLNTDRYAPRPLLFWRGRCVRSGDSCAR